MKNILLGAGVVVIIGLLGYMAFIKPTTAFGNTVNSSGTFTSAKTAMIVWVPSTTAATSTSILNTDGTDRIIKQFNTSCTGLTTVNGAASASWTFQVATTAVSSLGLQGNTNYVVNTQVATTTAENYIASTTPGNTGSAFVRRWAPNTYLTFNANASSTGTTCVVGVDYIAT